MPTWRRSGGSSTPFVEEIEESRGSSDAAYIARIITMQRQLMVAGRLTLFASSFPPAWVAGTALLAVGKILENMEIGHNVMHGQWDWMNDPEIHSGTWEWDNTCPADQWKHSHNFVHHTFTNVLDKDNDVGYGILRVTSDQKWHAANLGQPVYYALLALLFEWGVALHDLDIVAVRKREKDPSDLRRQLKGIWRKVRRQVAKDYLIFPLLTGPNFLVHALGQRDRQPRAQPVVQHDHLLRPLPRRGGEVHRGAARRRDQG